MFSKNPIFFFFFSFVNIFCEIKLKFKLGQTSKVLQLTQFLCIHRIVILSFFFEFLRISSIIQYKHSQRLFFMTSDYRDQERITIYENIQVNTASYPIDQSIFNRKLFMPKFTVNYKFDSFNFQSINAFTKQSLIFSVFMANFVFTTLLSI